MLVRASGVPVGARRSAQAAAASEVDYGEEENGARERHEQCGRRKSTLVDGVRAHERRYEPTAQDRSNNADDDVDRGCRHGAS